MAKWFDKLFKKEQPKVEAPKPEKLSPKEAATANGDPWVTVLDVELDMDNPGAGAFNLDWNEIFVARLVKAGYKGKDDVSIVDQWFTDVCRHVVMETYEQEMADPELRASEERRR